MNKYRKVMTYILVGGASLLLLASCKKDDKKDEPAPQLYDVTIVFGFGNWQGIKPENVQNAAAPTEVRNVILESDGKTLNGAGSTNLKNIALKPAFDASTKVRGRGNLKDVTIENVQDSLQFVEWGFTVNQK